MIGVNRCTCGGILHRHGASSAKSLNGAQRYICATCRKTFTVRDGQISTLRGRPALADWRTSNG